MKSTLLEKLKNNPYNIYRIEYLIEYLDKHCELSCKCLFDEIGLNLKDYILLINQSEEISKIKLKRLAKRIGVDYYNFVKY